MIRLGDFLAKQGRFLLENDNQALFWIAVLALIPFAGWLSAAVMALITLRKGWAEGLKGLLVAFLVLLLVSLMAMPFSAALITAVIAFLPCYLTAGVLHSTASWRVAGGVIVLQALLAIALIHWLAPEFIMHQYQYVQAIVKELEKEGSTSSSLVLLSNKNRFNQIAMANYLIGVQSLSLALSALFSLLLARFVQSRLFYPGGFRKEMLAVRASSLGLILLVFVVLGAYWHSPLAISCLPILVAYYVLVGLSLAFNILAKGKGIGTFILLIVPLILLPFVMLPIYVILGALDSLFNFRSYLPVRADGKEKKR